jgi:hypothetical protein
LAGVRRALVVARCDTFAIDLVVAAVTIAIVKAGQTVDTRSRVGVGRASVDTFLDRHAFTVLLLVPVVADAVIKARQARNVRARIRVRGASVVTLFNAVTVVLVVAVVAVTVVETR